jgi:hypothetical protein
MDEAIAFFWLKGEGRSLFSVQRGRGDRFFLAKGRGAIAFFWLKGEGRSLFFFIEKRAITVYLHGKWRSLFSVQRGRGDRFFLAKGRGAIAFFCPKGKRRSLFFLIGKRRSLFIFTVRGDRFLSSR